MTLYNIYRTFKSGKVPYKVSKGKRIRYTLGLSTGLESYFGWKKERIGFIGIHIDTIKGKLPTTDQELEFFKQSLTTLLEEV